MLNCQTSGFKFNLKLNEFLVIIVNLELENK